MSERQMDRHTSRRTGRHAGPLTGRRRGARIAVTGSFLAAIVASAIGVGALGGVPIEEAAGGLLATDATHVAPASPAFSLWSVIYAALGLYTLWQWWDQQDPRRVTTPAIASLLLNGGWILTVRAGWIWPSVLVILTLLVVLAELFRRTSAVAPRSAIERVVVDGTFGLYLGWVCVATCANITAALVGSGAPDLGRPDLLASAGIVVAGLIGLILALRGRGAVAAPIGFTWGLAWIAVARTTGAPESVTTATSASIAALAVGLATALAAVRRLRRADPASAR